MQPGKQPKFVVVTLDNGVQELRIVSKDGFLLLVVATSRVPGVLGQTKAELENSVLDFEEYSESWQLHPDVRKKILESIQ